MAFITRDVRATALRLFRVLMVLFLGIGMTVDCFQRWETMLVSIDFWNRIWNTPPNCEAQKLKAQPLMFGPGELFCLVLLRGLTTSSDLKVSVDQDSVLLKSLPVGWSCHSQIWCKRS